MNFVLHSYHHHIVHGRRTRITLPFGLIALVKPSSVQTRQEDATPLERAHTPGTHAPIAPTSIISLLLDGHLSDADVSLRTRRLMLKAITKTLVIPRSLFVTGVKIKIDRDYIASGGFGLVFKEKGGDLVISLVEFGSNRMPVEKR
ncbi:hypothetical protein F5887DRAFT_924819 [Amanita rubescens]|nr:hypothetical protein F5887DRAFT_924819 [Amanita rubescens]